MGSNDTDLTSYSLRQGFDIIVDSSVYHAIAYLSVRLLIVIITQQIFH